MCIFAIVCLLAAGADTLPAQPNEAGFGGEYSSLRPEQKRLVNDWFERFSKTIGKPVSPEEGYNHLPLSVKTTFNAVTHALRQTKLTDKAGQSLGDSALTLIDKVDTVAGQEQGAGGDKQFRMYVQLAPGAMEILTRSREFDRKVDNTVYHRGYPICFRSGGGTPSIQVSLTRNESRADIDVDYRSSKFPGALVNGHLSASNSDVRAGNNDEIHNRQWSGLQNWWRNLLGLPVLEQPAQADEGVIPRNPRVKAGDKPEEAVLDFLNSWLVTKKINEAIPYFSERSYACMDLKTGKTVDRGIVRYAAWREMRATSDQMGQVESLGDVTTAIRLSGERLKMIEQPHHTQFVLYDVREDLAQEFLCENKLEGAEPPAQAMRSTSYGKYVGAVFRLGTAKRSGETVATLWAKEDGYWKLISYEIEPELQPNRVPNTAAAAPASDAEPLRHVDGDKAMIQAANDFHDQWLVRGNVDKALAYLAPSCNACVKLYHPEEVPESATPAEARARLSKGMVVAAEAARPAKTLEDAIVAPEPHHQDLMLVNHDHANAFLIVSVPDYMAKAADCASRKPGEEPNLEPAESGRDHGNYYATGFSLRHTVGDSAVLWAVWGKQEGGWRIVSYLIISP